jgi:hypothetical protein
MNLFPLQKRDFRIWDPATENEFGSIRIRTCNSVKNIEKLHRRKFFNIKCSFNKLYTVKAIFNRSKLNQIISVYKNLD